MSNPQEVVEAIKKGLEPYVKPRAEAAHIRSVLAAHLNSCISTGPVATPLALVDPSCEVEPSPNIRGVQREYLEALSANVQAQREYASVRDECVQGPPSTASSRKPPTAGRLEDHLTALKLQKKRERLEVVIKYLDLLGEKPAASPEFLDPDEVFKDCDPLPAVPTEVVSGFTLDKDITKTDLSGLVTRLEKAVLRSKMLLKREEQLLGEVKSRASAEPGAVSDAAKLAALSSTRNELINWIETELGKVSGDGAGQAPEGAGAGGGAGQAAADKGHLDEQLASIKERYAQYLGARKSLVQLVSQSPQPTINPPSGQQAPAEPGGEPPQPTTHLLAPYIESLLQVAHEQKAAIAEKSHLSGTLARQIRDTCQAMDHLAEESQLLPAHPPPGGVRKKAASGLGGPGSEKVSDSVKGWVYAAESAKIATLENVTEQVEEGQLALEASTKALDEVDYLLRRDKPETDSGAPDAAADDIWLGEAQPRGGGAAARKYTHGKSGNHKADGGIWSVLDGNLGLINSDSST